jgi:DNA polymerase (family X)
MRKEIPAATLELLTMPGLRPDKALKLYKEFGISSVEELEQAAKQDPFTKVKGLGPALQNKILQGIEIKRRSEGQRHLHRAAALLELAQAQLMRSRPGSSRITPAGDFRRGCELIGDLSLVAQVSDPHAVSKQEDQSPLALHLTDKQHYGAALLLATGSQEHLRELREIAAARGMTLDKDGLRKGDKIIASRSEEEIYHALGLQFVEPELREGRGEITLAQKGKLPTLVTDADLRGILHAHTDRSDGVDTLEAMAEATRDRGYSYFGIADHSRSARYAGGLSLEEIAAQHAEIDQLNRRYGKRFRIFKGIESDILADGSLDYPDEILTKFDFVVASVHGRFKLDRKEQTGRILRAVSKSPHDNSWTYDGAAVVAKTGL